VTSSSLTTYVLLFAAVLTQPRTAAARTRISTRVHRPTIEAGVGTVSTRS